MHLDSLTITGYRGFSSEQTLNFAQPTGMLGSGLTILIGPNNGGKSTVVESLAAIFSQRAISFTTGKRNSLADDRISFLIKLSTGEIHKLLTVDSGGSQTIREPANGPPKICYVLPSRRFFNPYFGRGITHREGYMSAQNVPQNRSQPLDNFSNRLFNVVENPENLVRFNEVLKKVIVDAPPWTIDQDDHGEYYVKCDSSGHSYTSDGLGEGVVSLLFLIDALYDSEPGHIIVVDEPELSLHPTYQRRLVNLLAEYAKDRQIVYATHSAHFVNFEHILNGAEVARVHKDRDSCVISQLSRETTDQLSGMLTNQHNPHILGLNAREAFFQDDGVIVLEGQEDVIYYPRVLEQLPVQFDLSDRFFGWGAGGADNVSRIAALLQDLGFKRIAAILDNDKRALIPGLQEKYPDYFFRAIPANDVRTKPARASQEEVEGLLHGGTIRAEFEEQTTTLFGEINDYLSRGSTV